MDAIASLTNKIIHWALISASFYVVGIALVVFWRKRGITGERLKTQATLCNVAATIAVVAYTMKTFS